MHLHFFNSCFLKPNRTEIFSSFIKSNVHAGKIKVQMHHLNTQIQFPQRTVNQVSSAVIIYNYLSR